MASFVDPNYMAALPPVPVRRFSVAEYQRLGEAGVLTEDDRVELLEGWVVPKMIRSPRHDSAIELLTDALRSVVPAGWRVRAQSALSLGDSQPEPDCAIVRGAPRNHLAQHPAPPDVAMVAEVADTSLMTDRTLKGRICARAGIPVYWIINLTTGALEMYANPSRDSEPSYRERTTFTSGQYVAVIIEEKAVGQIAVRDLLP